MLGRAIVQINPGKKSPPHANRGQKSPRHANGARSIDTQVRLIDEIKEHLKNGSTSQLKTFLGSLSGTSQEVMNALFTAIFEDVEKGFAKEVMKKKKKYLAAATHENGSQFVLLNSIESFCGNASPEAVKEVALIVKALYDKDVLEEEIILKWYKKGLAGGSTT